MVHACGLWTWKTNSIISHAVSSNQDGPYTYSDTVAGPFAHNPRVIRAPDGTYLLFHIGSWATTPQNCSAHDAVQTSYPGPNGDQCGGGSGENGGCGLVVSSSESPFGPWTHTPIIIANQNESALLDCTHTNPAPFVLPNGSLALLVNAGYCHNNLETIGIVRADAWNGTYTLANLNPIFTNPDGSPHKCEDPTLWVDARGWHAMVHNMEGPQIALYAHSLDGYTWVLHADASNPGPYTGTIKFDNGTQASYDVERPQLIWDATGTVPLYLSNGVLLNRGSGASTIMFRPLKQT